MAKRVITAAYVSIGAVDYSAQVKGAELSMTAPDVNVTNMLSAGWDEFLAGVKTADLRVDFVLDGDLSGLDSALWTAFNGGTTLAFEVRATNAAVGTTNPKYTGSLFVSQHNPITGNVGDAYSASRTYKVTGAVTRATA